MLALVSTSSISLCWRLGLSFFSLLLPRRAIEICHILRATCEKMLTAIFADLVNLTDGDVQFYNRTYDSKLTSISL